MAEYSKPNSVASQPTQEASKSETQSVPVMKKPAVKNQKAQKRPIDTVGANGAGGGDEGGGEKKKRRKKGKESYKNYIHDVLKQVHPELRISNKAMGITNNFVYDLFERLAKEASVLAKKSSHSTIQTRDIQTAVRLICPGELGTHSISEGLKCIKKYNSHKNKN
ncbi:histone-fold-containing protein [Mrakia frigida]|uniref:histone H2B family protein n=1 Tax=Mrakia frigida TaxID=29902 RepID=UPI003FCBFDDA